jgi:hypothetical protein
MCAPLVLSGHPLTAWRPARMLSARPRTRWVRNDLGQRVQLVRGEGLGVSDQYEGRRGGGGGPPPPKCNPAARLRSPAPPHFEFVEKESENAPTPLLYHLCVYGEAYHNVKAFIPSPRHRYKLYPGKHSPYSYDAVGHHRTCPTAGAAPACLPPGPLRTPIPPPPVLRTDRTRRVPPPILIGHAESLPPY